MAGGGGGPTGHRPYRSRRWRRRSSQQPAEAGDSESRPRVPVSAGHPRPPTPTSHGHLGLLSTKTHRRPKAEGEGRRWHEENPREKAGGGPSCLLSHIPQQHQTEMHATRGGLCCCCCGDVQKPTPQRARQLRPSECAAAAGRSGGASGAAELRGLHLTPVRTAAVAAECGWSCTCVCICASA